jgi:hypothetical protein
MNGTNLAIRFLLEMFGVAVPVNLVLLLMWSPTGAFVTRS